MKNKKAIKNLSRFNISTHIVGQNTMQWVSIAEAWYVGGPVFLSIQSKFRYVIHETWLWLTPLTLSYIFHNWTSERSSFVHSCCHARWKENQCHKTSNTSWMAFDQHFKCVERKKSHLDTKRTVCWCTYQMYECWHS